MIGLAAVLLAVGWSAYNFVGDWPSRYRGGVLYDRAVHEHIVNGLLRYAALVAGPLLAYLYQVFGYDLVAGGSSQPHRQKLAGALFALATVIAAGFALLVGGGWLLQFLMEATPH